MVRIEVDIDIEDYLGEVDTLDLINELEYRTLSLSEKKRLIAAMKLKENEYSSISETPPSIRDLSKIEAFFNKYKDIPEAELDAFLNKY